MPEWMTPYLQMLRDTDGGSSGAGGGDGGGTGSDSQGGTSTDTAKPDDKGDPDKDLGEAGRRAIAAERAARTAAEKALKAKDAELQKLRDAAKTESEKALDKAREEGRAEARAEARLARLESRVVTRAAGKMANPADAVLFVDLHQWDAIEDLKDLSDAQVDKVLADLLKERPYLAGKPTVSRTGGDGGGSTGESAPSMNDLIRIASGRK